MFSFTRTNAHVAKALTLSAGLLSLVAMPAEAQLVVEAPSTTVSVADLDLSQASDRKRLDMRIKSASRRICDSGSIRLERNTDQKCRQVAQASTASQVAALTERANRLAAAGASARIATAISIAAPEAR